MDNWLTPKRPPETPSASPRIPRTARLVLAGLRAAASVRDGAIRHLHHLRARPKLDPALQREAEARLRALTALR